jgi:hypothetical protein
MPNYLMLNAGRAALIAGMLLAFCPQPATAQQVQQEQLGQQQVDWQNVPENIQRTILSADGGRQPDGVEMRTEDGKTVYQATVYDPAGLRRIVRTDAEGHLLAEEERHAGHDVDWSNVPPQAKSAILSQSQHLELEEVEQQQIGGTITYVAEFQRTDGTKLVVTVTPTGQILNAKSRSANY